ncbi:SDR family oxidoreductase [uncultured Hymenobacter sp.]|uniref:SDR family oxidoreductase n=1 Tax=uncultured Hymenobacter sp. TaxID=170016 RepID=UPI0035CC90FF
MAAKPLLITGAHGTLARAFERICHTRGLAAVTLARAELDIAEPASIAAALRRHKPWAVVNTAGYVRVDEAEADEARCFRENTEGPAALALACAAHELPLLTFSSDLVFDGQQAEPYVESAPTSPLNVYGRSKAEAEKQVLAQHPDALVVRTSAFFGPWDAYNFVCSALQAGRAGQPFAAADDVRISPTYVPDLVNTSLDLLIDEASGIWHVANQTACTWAEFAQAAARAAGLRPDFIRPQPMASFGLPAARPAQTMLLSERGMVLPSLEDALGRCVWEMRLEGQLA